MVGGYLPSTCNSPFYPYPGIPYWTTLSQTFCSAQTQVHFSYIPPPPTPRSDILMIWEAYTHSGGWLPVCGACIVLGGLLGIPTTHQGFPRPSRCLPSTLPRTLTSLEPVLFHTSIVTGSGLPFLLYHCWKYAFICYF